MNINEYIESGILEAYVLGALSEKERAQVEADMSMYPEIAKEKLAIEEAMQRLADDESVVPPEFMQDKIWDEIKPTSTKIEQPTKSIPISNVANEPATKPSWQRAAVWAAVLVSVLTNFMLLSQRNESKEQQAVLAAKLDSVTQVQNELSTIVASYKKEKDMIVDPEMETIILRKEGNTKAAGMVYLDKKTGDAYLAFNDMDMPPEGMQYQLWVIEDGKPVDMGMIPNDMIANEGAMQKISTEIASVQAFAISLEKEGGNPTPTEVYMQGSVSS